MPSIKQLLEECQYHSIELLKQNLTEHGLMAASLNEKSNSRSYHCIFGRDAALSALGMVLTGDHELIQGGL